MSWIIQSIIVIPLLRRRLYWYSQGLKIFPLQVWVSLGLLASERDPPNFNYWILQLKLAFEYNKTKYNQHKPVLKVNFPPASFGWQEILKNHQNSLLREELPAGAPIQVKFKSNHSLICLLPPESSSLSLISSTVTGGICLLIDKASHTQSPQHSQNVSRDWSSTRLMIEILNWSELIWTDLCPDLVCVAAQKSFMLFCPSSANKVTVSWPALVSNHPRSNSHNEAADQLKF